MSARPAIARRVPLAAGLVLTCAPAIAQACAVCNAGGSPSNRFAFFLSTMVLSLLPLGLFVMAALWVRARILARFADEFSDRDGSPLANETATSPLAAPAPRAG